jgi:hypothetical protein
MSTLQIDLVGFSDMFMLTEILNESLFNINL